MKTCFAYICNAAYLVPALVSAGQARRNVAPDLADIFVFDIGEPSKAGDLSKIAAEKIGVNYRRFDASVMDGHALAYGRMMLDRMLPDEFRDFVYVDSDTQVWGRLDELAAAPVPEGRILASRDPSTIMIEAGGPLGEAAAKHIESLSLKEGVRLDYINSGMMKVGRKHWGEVAKECLRHKSGTERAFLHHDQDVINIVAEGMFDTVSFKWNFPGFLLQSGLAEKVGPRLVHFMSNPRPWHGGFYPWGARGMQPYEDFSRQFPDMRPYWPRLTMQKYAKYVLLQRLKQSTELPYWRSSGFHQNFERSEAAARL